MPKPNPPKKKQNEITVAKLLKRLRKKKKSKKKTADTKKSLLPTAELRQEKALADPELSEEIYVTEEEAFGPEIQNDAYLVLARRYRWGRWGVIALLLIFLVCMFNFFKEEITLENFRYLMRNVNFEIKTEIDEEGAILYDSDDTNIFEIFKSSLAVTNGQKLAIYDAGGRTSCTAEFSYASPALKASDKYLIAYDRSGGDYSLYSSFTQMHSGSTGYPISDVDVTDSGVYAIASRSKEYFGEVTIYNSAFNMLGKIRKNKYIAAIDLSEDGKSILIASYFSGESGYVTELMSLRVDSDEPDLLFTLENTFPYRVQWTEAGEFMLCGSSGIKFFDKDGKVYNEYTFSGQNVIKYSVDASGVAVVTASTADSGLSTLTVLDHKGKQIGVYSADGAIESLAISDGIVCLTSDRVAWKLEEGKFYRATTDSRFQTSLQNGELTMLCGYTRVLTPEWNQVKE